MGWAAAAAAGFAGGVAAQLSRLPLMGLEKAVLEPMSRRLFRRTTARITPYLAQLFDALDPLMPARVANLNAADLERTVIETLEKISGEEWPDPREIEPFWQLYDPRINAEKTTQVLLALQQ